jgi:membrane fusion protein (multidrug efflux system)
LLELKAVSQEEYDRSENQLGIIQVQIELMHAQIQNTEVYAPFSGYIGLRHVSPGEFVSSSTIVARLLQTDPVKVEFSIPEKYREKIKKGTSIAFQVEGIDSTFTGRVYAIESRIDPSTRNITLRASCFNPRNILVPGAFAKVELLLEVLHDALVLPSEAIIPQINGEKVLLCKNGQVCTRMIQTGIRTEREVQVVSGLQVNDTVITSGLLQLREGMPVNIRIP